MCSSPRLTADSISTPAAGEDGQEQGVVHHEHVGGWACLLAGEVGVLGGDHGDGPCGFGLGSLMFQALLLAGFTSALVVFGTAAAVAAALAVRLFDTET